MASAPGADLADVPSNSATSEKRTSFQNWYLVGVLSAVYALAYIDRHVIGLLVKPIKETFSLSDVEFSLLHGLSFALLYTTMGIPLGWAADRWNRKRLIVGGMVLWSLMTVLCGAARTYAQLFWARVGVGVGEATLSPAAYSMIGSSFPASRLGLPMSIFMMGSRIGGGLALIFGGAVIAYANGVGAFDLPGVGTILPWQYTLFLVGAPGLIMAAFMALTVREPARVSVRGVSVEKGGGGTKFLKHNFKLHGLLFLGYSAFTLVATGIVSWLPAFFERTHGWSIPTIAAGIGTIDIIGGVCGCLAAGALVDWLYKRGYRDGPIRLAIILLTAMIPLAMLAPLVRSAEISLVLYGVIVLLMGALLPLPAVAIQMSTPEHLRARVSAIFLLVANAVGYGVGPTVVAFFTDHVFRSEAMVGQALAATAACVLPLSIPPLLVARKKLSQFGGA